MSDLLSLVRRGLFILIGTACLAACGTPASIEAERYDVYLDIQPDGLLVVRESIALTFAGDGDRVFDREVANGTFDRIELESVTANGLVVRGVESPDVQLEASDGDAMRVRVTVAETLPARTTIGLRYRAIAALRVRGPRGVLEWQAVPARRPYPIAASRLELSVPDARFREGSVGVSEAGWTVVRNPSGITATREGIPPNQSATVQAEIPIETGAMPEPRWQFDEARRGEFVPAFVAGGLFIFVVGAGILWIVRWQYPRIDTRTRGALSPGARGDYDLVARGLWTSGWVAMALAVACGVATHHFLWRFGAMPLVIPATVFLVGVMLVHESRR